MKLKELITEGGWASTATQDTIITPELVGRAITATEHFIEEFNVWLEEHGHPTVRKGNPVGSSYYWKRDLEQNPHKEYGDVDYLVYIPQIPNMTNAQNSTMYADLTRKFADTVDGVDTHNGINLIFRIDSDFVQVDFVHGYYELKEWLRALLPEYNVKGVISSSLYSSIAQVLNLSIGSYGVQAKLRNNTPVPFGQRKDTELVTISKSPDKWAKDILVFYGKLAGIEPKIPPGQMGIKPGETRVADIAATIKWLAGALQHNGLFGKGALHDIANQDVMVKEIRDVFVDKMQNQINNPKFEKAATPTAVAKVEQTKAKLQHAIEWVDKLLI